MTSPDIRRLERRHNTNYKLAMSSHQNPPEEKWCVAQCQPYRQRWQNVIVNVTLDDAMSALKSVGSIT